MDTFKVGEVAVGQNFVVHPEYNGMEVIVTRVIDGELEMCDGEIFVGVYYRTEWANGHKDYHPSRYLRKKRPPESDEAAARQAMLDCIQKAKQPVGATA